jgi:ATP-dependent RNA helicase RhlE
LSDILLRAVEAEGYTCPTSIQAQAIPHVLAGRDLLACAQTGTGKTAAFALPLLDLLNRTPEKARKLRVLVLAPTRELGSQIDASFRVYGRNSRLRCLAIYGGVSQKPQATGLSRGVDVVVATPGRLLDLIGQRLIDLRHVQHLVLDEADRMLDMGFITDVRKICAQLPAARQTLLFSATVPPEINQLASVMLRDPAIVRVAQQSSVAPTIEQTVYFVEPPHKRSLLVSLLGGNETSRSLVFTKTKRAADRLHRELCKAGIRAGAIHGDKTQAARERILAGFRSEDLPVLVATDVASRGLDVDRVSHVFNYDMPREPETYVHRIGRTGRAGLSGIAISFCCVEERPQLRAVERLIKQSIAVVALGLGHGTPQSETDPPASGHKPANGGAGGRRKSVRRAGGRRSTSSSSAQGQSQSRSGGHPAAHSQAKRPGKNGARRRGSSGSRERSTG